MKNDTFDRVLPCSVLSCLALLLFLTAAQAQAPPGTDIHLLRLEKTADGWKVDAPKNVTPREGYDNQPSFLDERRLLYTSIAGDQADIQVYDLESGKTELLTETAESEYSPTPIPGEEAISVVRVEADSTQRLWRFPLDGGAPSLLLPNIEAVGYHAWADDENLALFVLGDPSTLQKARRGDGGGEVLVQSIGRAIHRVPDSTMISYVRKDGDDWTIEQIALAQGEVAQGEATVLLKTRPEREDFVWSPGGELWTADGSVLYVARPPDTEDHPAEWRRVADLSEHGLKGITRMAVHPTEKWLAVVAEE